MKGQITCIVHSGIGRVLGNDGTLGQSFIWSRKDIAYWVSRIPTTGSALVFFPFFLGLALGKDGRAWSASLYLPNVLVWGRRGHREDDLYMAKSDH